MPIHPYFSRDMQVMNHYDSTAFYKRQNGGTNLLHYFSYTYQYHAPFLPAAAHEQTFNITAQSRKRWLSDYDAQNRLTRTVQLEYNAGGNNWDTALVRTFTYDAQGKLTQDASRQYLGGTSVDFLRNNYTYTPQGLLQQVQEEHFQGGWNPESRTTFTWNNQNQLRVMLTEAYTTGAFTPSFVDTFTYSANGQYVTRRYNRSYNSTTNTWGYDNYRELHLNAQGFPDTAFRYRLTNGAWEMTNKHYVHYNANNNPVYRIAINYNLPATHDLRYVRTNFYYEPVNPPLSMPDISVTEDEITLFPNPAADHLHIRCRNASLAQAIVINSVGQIVLIEQLQAGREAALDVKSLPSGTYRLVLTGSQGKAAYCRSWVKLP